MFANSLFQVNVPICAMKGGIDLQKYIDLLVPGNAKIKIIHGEVSFLVFCPGLC